MAHILFIDSSGVGLQAIATARRLGHAVTLILPEAYSLIAMTKVPMDDVRRAVGSNERIIASASMESPLVETALSIDRSAKIDAVITTSELAVIPASEVAERLGTRYDHPGAVKAAVFKDRLRTVLKDNAIPSTPHAVATGIQTIRAAVDTIGYPVVVKPTRGTAKESSAILKNDGELERFFADLTAGRRTSIGIEAFLSPQFVVEAYIVGAFYSAEIIAIDGELQLLTTMRRARSQHDDLLEVAAAMPSGLRSGQDRVVLDYLRRIFECLGLEIGIYHVEFIMSADGPRLVEINARMMGGTAPILFQALTGVDPYELLIDLHLGRLDDFRPPAVVGAGVILAVGAPSGGVLPDDAKAISQAILAQFDVVADRTRIEDRLALRPFAGNFSNLGSLVIRTDAAGDAMGEAQEVLTRLERGLGIELAKIRLEG